MAFCRTVFRALNTFIPPKISSNTNNLCYLKHFSPNVVPQRGITHNFAKFEKIMKKRRKLAGPERLRKRNELAEWNHKAELYAFTRRLQENISEDTLRTAFTNESYIVAEEQKRTELGVPVQDVPLKLIPNTHLISIGYDIMDVYIKGFLRHSYAALPEEGICALFGYLTSDDVLAHVSSNIGTKDLILSAEFPYENSTLADTLKAIIGAIATDSTRERAELFVADFICPQLIGKDVLDIWNIPNPKEVLSSLLDSHGRAAYEPRLVFESGRNTLESIFVVALYSSKVFLGQSPGETLEVAEELAAEDALRRLFNLTMTEKPLSLGKHVRNLQFQAEPEHVSLAEWRSEILADRSRELV